MEKFVVKRKGNYRDLICYRKAETIYDITYFFANRFFKSSDRTIDQMIQAARSGKQNIIEGYAASVTSIETEIKLLNVAKSSLKELLADYEDYLRTRHLEQWDKESEKFKSAQQLGKDHDDSTFWMDIISSRNDETIANIAIILLHQTDYLLYKFIEKVVAKFEKEGGIREKLSELLRNKKKDNEK